VRHAAAIDPAVQAIRIDSGELEDLARRSRAILDQCGRAEVQVMLSGDLDEERIAQLVGAGAPVDGFGVGTELVTSRDAPALAVVYKLVELDGQGRFKLSPGKKTYPMAKQVFRRRDPAGRFAGDHVTRADETAEGEPLLVPMVRQGRLVAPLPRLDRIRQHCREQLASLPERLLPLDAPSDYPISYSEALEADARRLMMQ
jgi:nicotinate phosphoribosyltransferase